MHVFYSVNPEKFPLGDTEALSLMLFQHAIVCKISLNMLFVRCLTRSLCLSLYACVTLPPSTPTVFLLVCDVLYLAALSLSSGRRL